MQINNKKAIAISILIILSIAASMAVVPQALGQLYPPRIGPHVTSYAQINVAPNPIGVGQTVTVNMYLAVPLETSEFVQNMTLYITDPNGHQQVLGPFTSDATGGTAYSFAPDTVGNYSIYWVYPGQTLTSSNLGGAPWRGLITDGSTSPTIQLQVQQEPIQRSAYPIVPLPTTWWETPVTAENIQNWYAITGPWLGLGSNPFASTGNNGLNDGPFANAYTADVVSGHVIWTLPWGAGGVPGGLFGGTESSNFWMTRQYQPNFAAVVMNGILYSTQYTTWTSTSGNNGIFAINLFTGETLFNINTTNALRCGMMLNYKNPNQYGVVGPFLWTTGALPASDTGGTQPAVRGGSTQWNMYDATSGRYMGSIVNGTGLSLSVDDQGGLIGYYINNTAGTEIMHVNGQPYYGDAIVKVVTNTGPHLEMFNFTTALLSTGNFNLAPNRNFVIDWRAGLQFATPVATQLNGLDISPALSINSVDSYVVGMTGGFIHGQGVGGEQAGWLVVSGMDGVTGAQLMLKNITTSDTAVMEPFTRISYGAGAGKEFIFDGFNWKGVAYDLKTGDKLWETQLTPLSGYQINPYDVFNFKTMYANGQVIAMGFGGDMWGVNATTGEQIWTQNTLNLLGDPGIETPYGTWPLWVFAAQAQSPNVAYFGIGHEYNPPLFHGAQMLAINTTDGSLVWKELGFYTRAMEIADGVLTSVNEYSNEVFAFAKGPTQTTVDAPSVGINTATPITITGRVTDVSPGTEQDAVARNYPNGVPAVSDASQSAFMETVYQQQPMPYNITGVPVTLSVYDQNGNFREIGTTKSDAMGNFGFTWTPDIAGNFNIVASFAGSNSYYGSSSSTYFYAGEKPTSAPTQQPASGLATTADLLTYLAAGVIAIIIAIAIVGLLILRRRP